MQAIILILLKALELYSYVLLAYVILSWIPSLYDSTLGRLIIWLVSPVIKPFRKFNLQFFGLDWTVFVIMIVFNLVARFLLHLLSIM